MSASSDKSAFRSYCEAFRQTSADLWGDATHSFFSKDANINVVHPFNDLSGAQAYQDTFLASLGASFKHLRRSDYIAHGGTYEDQNWLTCTGYYTGLFDTPWLGIQPTNTVTHLRFGEFHRMENGQAVESYIYLDIPELMIAAGQWPIKSSPGLERGFTGFLPGPVSQDGHQWHENQPTRSASSVEMVTTMLRGLATKDEAWRPYWHNDMMWYGPAAFGTFVGLEAFAGFQVPFEGTFSEWIGGSVPGSQTKHFARFADGDYVASGGWPSLNAVQIKPFLDQPAPIEADGKRLFMRVCDWWRREEDLLVENWVFVDIPHVLLQMGFDVFAELEKTSA
ncbi:MAG: hypothetical protein ACPGVN_08300 [Alphaproteobacteria bacterium]